MVRKTIQLLIYLSETFHRHGLFASRDVDPNSSETVAECPIQVILLGNNLTAVLVNVARFPADFIGAKPSENSSAQSYLGRMSH